MASGLKRDTTVILRIDGEDLLEFINSPSYEPDMISIFSQIDKTDGSLLDYIAKVLQKLTVDHGMPPLSDPWVMSNIVEPALQSGVKHDGEDAIIEQEMVLEEFKKVAERLGQLLKDKPVIVAHTEQTFDGSSIRRLLSNNFEFNKTLEVAMKDLPKDDNGKISKEHLRVALDLVGTSAGLPPFGAIIQMDSMVQEAIHTKIVEVNEGKMIEKEEFKKAAVEILESIMSQLEENPISVSSNLIVHEPLSSSSTIATPSTP